MTKLEQFKTKDNEPPSKVHVPLKSCLKKTTGVAVPPVSEAEVRAVQTQLQRQGQEWQEQKGKKRAKKRTVARRAQRKKKKGGGDEPPPPYSRYAK